MESLLVTIDIYK